MGHDAAGRGRLAAPVAFSMVILFMMVLPKNLVCLPAASFVAVLLACVSVRADNAQIDHWIDQLDSDQYQVREEATRELLATGTAALDALTSAASGDRPEPADRAVWILEQLADTGNLDQRQAVLEHMIQLKNWPQVVTDAKDALAGIKNDAAVEAIQKLGGRVVDQAFDARRPQQTYQQVVLDDAWRGGDMGLKHLAGLREVGIVTVVRTNVSREGLEQLKEIESLQYLHLYGTQLDESDEAALKQALPGVEIDFRRGALLGIQGSDMGPARVMSVKVGTAAANADIRRGDIIQKFNGEPVKDFKQLTSKIAECLAGDVATLEIQRDGQTKEIKVTLGRWETL